jgi:hypothetical protein
MVLDGHILQQNSVTGQDMGDRMPVAVKKDLYCAGLPCG